MTEPPPKISIIITCYNYARYVRQAIESAIHQTYDKVEVVVVDDGSTDGSADVIEDFAGQIIAIRQENQGHIAAFNRGFRESTGDVAVFLDADDALYPTLAEEVARLWRPACVKVQYDLAIIDRDGTFLGRKFCNFPARYGADDVRREFNRLGTYTWPITSGNAYSRWFLERVMPLDVPEAPDGTLNSIAPLYGEILTIVRPLACYRLHGGNIWAISGKTSEGLADELLLEKRIARRYAEIATLRSHAALQGVVLPKGNVLDHEIAFLNYRLMALKLGVEYAGMAKDSPARLWWCAVKLLTVKRLPARHKAMHFLWMTIFALVPPRWPAGVLIVMRFNRSAYLQPIRKFLGKDVRVAGTESAA